MIDPIDIINQALRQAAAMSQRMQPNPAWDRHVEEVKASSRPVVDLRRRPDGVWEMSE